MAVAAKDIQVDERPGMGLGRLTLAEPGDTPESNRAIGLLREQSRRRAEVFDRLRRERGIQLNADVSAGLGEDARVANLTGLGRIIVDLANTPPGGATYLFEVTTGAGASVHWGEGDGKRLRGGAAARVVYGGVLGAGEYDAVLSQGRGIETGTVLSSAVEALTRRYAGREAALAARVVQAGSGVEARLVQIDRDGAAGYGVRVEDIATYRKVFTDAAGNFTDESAAVELRRKGGAGEVRVVIVPLVGDRQRYFAVIDD